MPAVASPVAIPANTETTLGTITPVQGQMTTVTIDRTVSRNAISAPTLNSLPISATVAIKIYASTDDGVSFYQVAACTIAGGIVTATAPGGSTSPVTTCELAVSMAAGEVQHKVTVTPSAACGLSAAVSASAVSS